MTPDIHQLRQDLGNSNSTPASQAKAVPVKQGYKLNSFGKWLLIIAISALAIWLLMPFIMIALAAIWHFICVVTMFLVNVVVICLLIWLLCSILAS